MAVVKLGLAPAAEALHTATKPEAPELAFPPSAREPHLDARGLLGRPSGTGNAHGPAAPAGL